jgi:glutathione S-transferase
MAELRVFTFSPAWGLPTSGPFALKLLAWLNLAGIAYDHVFEDDPRKGPLGKSPWIEFDGERLGDSEIIIHLLARRYAVTLDGHLTAQQSAAAHAWTRAFEEHFHQVLEWELFCHPDGMAFIKAAVAAQMPPVARTLVWLMLRRHFRRQLHARGIGRHAPSEIAAKGRADLDALVAFLGDRDFLVSERPTTADAAVFGQVAPLVYWTMDTPVAGYARRLPRLCACCERMRSRCFDQPVKSATAPQSRSASAAMALSGRAP